MKKILLGLMLLSAVTFSKDIYCGRIVNVTNDSTINIITVSNQGTVRFTSVFFNENVVLDKLAMDYFRSNNTLNGLLLFYDKETKNYIIRVQKDGRHD